MGKLSRTLAAGLIASMLTACGGGGGSNAVPAPTLPQTKQTAAVSMTFTFNNRTGHSLRGRKYISRATQGVGVTFEANNGGVALPTTEGAMRSPSFAAQVGSQVATNNTTCTQASIVDGSFSCTLLIAAPAGYDNVQITMWDQAPTTPGYGGSFAGSANDLSTNNFTNQLILQNQTNAFNYALQGVVNSVYLSVNPDTLVAGAPQGQTATELLSLSANTAIGDTTFPVTTTAGLAPGQSVKIGTGAGAETLTVAQANGTSFVATSAAVNAHTSGDQVSVSGVLNPQNLTLNVLAKDADGNVILGSDHYVDADGNQITINVTAGAPNVPASPVGTSGNVTIAGVTSFTDPTVQQTALSYNAGDMTSEAFSATTTSALTIATHGATLNFTHTLSGTIHVGPTNLSVNEYSVGAQPTALAVGPDGNIWWGDGSNTIGTMNPNSGAIVNTWLVAATPIAMCADSVGSMTVFASDANVYRVTVAGAVSTLGALAAGAHVSSCALGPDGNVWFTDDGNYQVGRVNPYGSLAVATPVHAGAHVHSITTGPDGNMWFTDWSPDVIEKIGVNLDPSTQAAYAVSNAYTPEEIASAPDGNMYFTNNGAGSIGQITTSGIVNSAFASIPGGTNSLGITVGPDANIWYGGAPTGAPTTTIGRLAYGSPTPVFTVFSAGITSTTRSPLLIAGPLTAPNPHTIWFTEPDTGKIGEVVLP